jgi:hypothetical protein
MRSPVTIVAAEVRVSAVARVVGIGHDDLQLPIHLRLARREGRARRAGDGVNAPPPPEAPCCHW